MSDDLTIAEAFAEMGLASAATQEDAKSCFRRLAQARHPDKGGDALAFVRLKAAMKVVEQAISAGLNPDSTPIPVEDEDEASKATSTPPPSSRSTGGTWSWGHAYRSTGFYGRSDAWGRRGPSRSDFNGSHRNSSPQSPVTPAPRPPRPPPWDELPRGASFQLLRLETSTQIFDLETVLRVSLEEADGRLLMAIYFRCGVLVQGDLFRVVFTHPAGEVAEVVLRRKVSGASIDDRRVAALWLDVDAPEPPL